MEKNTSNEIKAAKEIVIKGLLKAAESLSFFMKETITLADTEYNANKAPTPSDFTSKRGENIHLLITEIIGELKGVCCLIFSEEEAEKLRNIALPQEIKENAAVMAEMSDGILLEVDNIISASVITQFSNLLNHKIYGGVPGIKKLNADEVNQYIKSKLEKDMFIVSFNTHFVSTHLDFSPQFLWLFNSSFAESIKRYASTVNQAITD